MILGMGVDIIDLASFQMQLDDPASSFVDGSFTDGEFYDATHRPGQYPTQHFAARYAAKEAFIKAWSAAIWGHPPLLSHVDMREIEIHCDRYQRPALRLHGAVKDAFETLGPTRLHVSLSHDGSYATATVVIEKAHP